MNKIPIKCKSNLVSHLKKTSENNFSQTHAAYSNFFKHFFLQTITIYFFVANIGHNVDCKHFLESSCLSVTIAALSSHDINIRKVAYLVLAQYQELLESSRFREKPQVSRLFIRKNGPLNIKY